MTQELSLFVQFHCIVVAVFSFLFFSYPFIWNSDRKASWKWPANPTLCECFHSINWRSCKLRLVFFPTLYTQALRGLALSIMCTDAIVFWVHSFKVLCRSSLVNRYSKKIISKPCYSLPLATSCKLFELFIFFVYWINLLPWCLLIPAGSNGDFSEPVWSD